ncbi:c3hc zinc finger domain-containing protein [Ophiostoma piceae UAMH 11346]|uniref:C3hc zinc finger domain-containing protein n=1 Tax=Ophiostoma piceae (strain UAMH 11346) TaxID=1262450 RepID=S3C2P0_OPHP1|nr:c3hc zinc finger domain-containing protein [Ophiostoma piceae UAMH 11346]
MNATKRKFNALLQGIGTRSPGAVSADDSSDALPRPSTDAASSAPSSTPSSGRISMQYAANSQPSVLARMASTATAATPSSAVANLEFLAKRRRLAEATATLRDTTGNAVVTPSTSSNLLRKWGSSASNRGGSSTATPAIPPPAPRYCPGDREQLLRRLATFQELTDWTPKPDRINEIEWAKRGWVCQGKERLRCTLCSKELVVRLTRDDAEKDKDTNKKKSASTESVVMAPLPSPEDTTQAALVGKYAELIVSAHQDSCLWQRKGCDNSLLRLSLASPRQALLDLRLRYDELCARKDFLPYEFNLRLPEGLDIDAVLATLPSDFFTTPAPVKSSTTSTPSPSPNRVALALAVMGWQGLTNSRIGAVPNSASCHACLRRLGLWMFKSKQVDFDTNTVLEPAPMDHLEAVREHRFFCPWRNGAIQRNPGGDARAGRKKSAVDVPGWDVLVQVLKNDAYLRNRLMPPGGKRPTTSAAPASPTLDDEAIAEPKTPMRRSATAAAVATPATATTPGVATPVSGIKSVFGRDSEADAEDEAARDAKDKERWARLRRVKSLFDTKGSKKLKRTGTASGNGSSRPNTSHSIRPETGGK